MKKFEKESKLPQEGGFVVRDFPQLFAMVFALFFAAFALDSSTVKSPVVRPVKNIAVAEIPVPKITPPVEVATAEASISLPKKPIKKPALTFEKTPALKWEKVLSKEEQKQPQTKTEVVQRTAPISVAKLPTRRVQPTTSISKKISAAQKIPSLNLAALPVPNPTVFSFTVTESKYELPQRKTEGSEEIIVDTETPEIKKKEEKNSDFYFRSDIKKRPDLTLSSDRKAAYSQTAAGNLLQLPDLSAVKTTGGIFVERSTDGIEYYSIGIINPEKKEILQFFDGEIITADRSYYRFRSQSEEGKYVMFGEIICRQNRQLSPRFFEQSSDGVFSIGLHARYSGKIVSELRSAADNRLISTQNTSLAAGENKLNFALTSEAKLLKLTLKSGAEQLDFLIESRGEGISATQLEQPTVQALPVGNKTTRYLNTSVLRRDILPVSIFSRNEAKRWKIPGLNNCPGMTLTVFNEWGLPVYHETAVTPDNVWDGTQNGDRLPAGIYSYVLGARGGWVQIE